MGKASFATLSDGENRSCRCTSARTRWGRRPTASSTSWTSATSWASTGKVMRTRAGELSVQARELAFPGQGPPASARRSGTASPTWRPAIGSGTWTSWPIPRSAKVFVARSAMVAEIRRFMDAPGLRRGRDPDDAAHRGGRRGAALRDPPQRPRRGPLPAHRPRALPEAAGGRRPRAGVRDQPELPERGDLVDAQPRVHDARVLHRLLRLRRRHRHHGGAARRRGAPAGWRDEPVSYPRARGLVRDAFRRASP